MSLLQNTRFIDVYHQFNGVGFNGRRRFGSELLNALRDSFSRFAAEQEVPPKFSFNFGERRGRGSENFHSVAIGNRAYRGVLKLI